MESTAPEGSQQSNPQPETPPVLQQQTVAPSLPEEQSKSSPRKVLVVVAFLVFAVLGGILGYFSLQSSEIPKPPPTLPLTPQPSEQADLPYVGTQEIALSNVTGGTSIGRAFRSINEFSSTLTIYTELPDPPEAQFYQAWFLKTDNYTGIDPQDVLPGQKLQKDHTGHYTYLSGFIFQPSPPLFTKLSDLRNILVVSLEAIDDDVMETKILQGTFTQ